MRFPDGFPRALFAAAVLTLGVGAAGCVATGSDEGSGADEGSGGAETQVDLEVSGLDDVNPTSATFEQVVHPADFQGQISAWYFGHAT